MYINCISVRQYVSSVRVDVSKTYHRYITAEVTEPERCSVGASSVTLLTLRVACACVFCVTYGAQGALVWHAVLCACALRHCNSSLK